ncbi:hypothetical protein DM02DRAFT_676759 [Periconia macrospinosa]|uniref:DUF7580 domain-containing protein n=1 Tax=Periconia macrospinosa TaxID=97972 RepID=A0A2V1D658_9PLEO|nr:hypothetical protein DM02DRAFT_676759 [Periconia macrospinosa]
MEVAGVVLGAVPIILYALDNYSKAWDPLLGIVRWKETIETIRLQFVLERQKLYITLGSLGLQVTETITFAEVEAALQINQPDTWKDFITIIHEMDGLLYEVAKDLYPDAKGPPSWDDARSERMNWEWRRVRRSFGSARRKEIFKTLRYYNSALQDCKLEKRETLLDTENQIISNIRNRFDENRTLHTRKNARLLHKAISSSWDCKCKAPHEGCIQLQWHNNKPVSAKAFDMILSYRKVDNSQQTNIMSWQAVSLKIEQLETEQELVAAEWNMTNLSISSIGVSVSSIKHAPTATQVSPQPQKKKGVRFLDVHAIKDKAKRLTGHSKSSSLPAVPSNTSTITRPSRSRRTSPSSSINSETANCVATTPPPEAPTSPAPATKLCSILQKPSAFQSTLASIPVPESEPIEQLRIISTDRSSISVPERRPIDLQALLSRQRDQTTHQRLRLNRKRRFAVASALTWAVLHLCDSPWLGQILTGDNIRFFLEQEDQSNTPQLSSHPYLAHAFKVPGTDSQDEGNNTSHRDQFYSKQVQNITLYTLAIRLIELGRDMSLPQLRREYMTITSDASKAEPDILDDFDVAKFHIRELELDPGIAYSHAVDRCLRFIFPGSADANTFENKSFRSMFFSDVVAPVQATYELIPGSCSQV